ncbi:hypothetical protein BBJ28_00001847 [Nothophytophthora sp. Chile5]|nr:hypothetical protein BBJ28_00001847 [Nothophytophthora sp. Chile5]
MEFDPRCYGFEGKLHADRRTLEYVGRGNHNADAACFRTARSSSSASPGGSSSGLRLFYYETQVLSTSSDEADACQAPSAPRLRDASTPAIYATGPRLAWRLRARRLIQSHLRDVETPALLLNERLTDQEQTEDMTMENGDAPTSNGSSNGDTRDRRRRAEQEAMDLEDDEDYRVLTRANGNGNGAVAGSAGMHFAFSLSSRTLQQMRARHERHRLRRSSERKRFNHRVAIGFSVETTSQSSDPRNSDLDSASRDFMQQMQRLKQDEDDESDEEEEAPAIAHEDLGQAASSVAYVGKTGAVVSNGREFLQCERYGAGDVVGCGVLLDTKTFFFTLNGRLMGMLAARDVYHLDDFEEDATPPRNEETINLWTTEDDQDETQAEEKGDGDARLDRLGDIDMDRSEESDGSQAQEKELYPSVSLHGVGECVHAVFTADEFKFDLAGFEQQIQKERQRALLLERERRSAEGVQDGEQLTDYEDEAAMNDLVQEFFLHYGYGNAYEAFEAANAPSKRSMDQLASMENGGVEEEEKSEDTVASGGLRGRAESVKQQGMRRSLCLRHEVREHIQSFRTAQALQVLEQHAPKLLDRNGRGRRGRKARKLLLHCRILCVIDLLTLEKRPAKAQTTTRTTTNASLPPATEPEDVQDTAWHAEQAIEYAQKTFGSFLAASANGKRKREAQNSKEKAEDASDIALVASLLLYDRRESVPASTRARRFLTPEFRASVADQLNSLLLLGEMETKPPASRVSGLETFLMDVADLQKECLKHGCRVYPESLTTTSTGKRTAPSRRRRVTLSSGSDESSSSSQSEQDDRMDDEEEEGE